MKRLPLIVLFLVGLLISLAVYYTDWLVKQQVQRSAAAHDAIQQTRMHWLQLQRQLDSELAYTHTDFDISTGLLQRIRQDLDTLAARMHHEQEGMLQSLRRDLEETAQILDRYHTLHAIIRNSTQQLPRLLGRYLKAHHQQQHDDHVHGNDRDYLALLAQAVSEVVLASSSLDLDYAPSLKELIQALENSDTLHEEDRSFNQLFVRHLQVIHHNLPAFLLAWNNLQRIPFTERLDQLEQQWEANQQRQLATISNLHTALALLFVLLLIYTAWLLWQLKWENQRLKGAQEALDLAVVSDSLTGLPNRLAWQQQNHKDGCLLLVNIDRFKHINDFYGNAAGDAVLSQLARLLLTEVDASLSSQIYRVGGDDFALWLPENWPEPPVTLANRLVARLERAHFEFEGHPVQVSVSVGISRHHPLLEKADLALKAVKSQRSQVKEYDPGDGLEQAVEHNLQMIDTIRQALKQNRVVAWFQPLLNNRIGQVDRYECLMRIQLPNGEVLTPWQFLNVGRDARLLGAMTCAMLRQALPYMRASRLGFSINLSMSDMLDAQVSNLLYDMLKEDAGLAHRITLEILETEAVEDDEEVGRFLARMRHLGCKLAIDDFGSGYSNLSQVLKLDVDQLKIDASLIRNLADNSKAMDTVQAILQFARAASIPSVVAEHVSDERIQRQVMALGIDYSQGYWIGKPEPELLPEEMLHAERQAPAPEPPV